VRGSQVRALGRDDHDAVPFSSEFHGAGTFGSRRATASSYVRRKRRS
jgi:hypothetical protein